MNARILTTATLTAIFTSVLPARAADPQLLSLVMPDAVAIAGVNVDQAKGSPFGQYILSMVQTPDKHLQELTTLTGFDPTRDVHEVLVASNSTAGPDNGLLLARGTFDVDRFVSAATSHEGLIETYKGVTIIEDTQKTHGVAFLSSTIAAAGSISTVKAAIDRQSSPASLPNAVLVQINYWSNSEDAWAVSTVSPASLHPPAGAPSIPGLGSNGNQNNAFTAIQQGAGGVKFGALVEVKAQAQTDTAQNASSLGDTIKLLASLAQMQGASKDPAAAALLQSLQVNASGTTVNVSVSLPADQLQQIVKPKAATVQRQLRKM